MEKEQMLLLRFKGWTYAQIGDEAGISRQRVQQLLSPPPAIRQYVVKRAKGLCQSCGIKVGTSGQVHHKNGDQSDTYNNIEELELLCISCHLASHSGGLGLKPSQCRHCGHPFTPRKWPVMDCPKCRRRRPLG